MLFRSSLSSLSLMIVTVVVVVVVVVVFLTLFFFSFRKGRIIFVSKNLGIGGGLLDFPRIGRILLDGDDRLGILDRMIYSDGFSFVGGGSIFLVCGSVGGWGGRGGGRSGCGWLGGFGGRLGSFLRIFLIFLSLDNYCLLFSRGGRGVGGWGSGGSGGSWGS